MSKQDETLRRYVSDMIAVERHILEPLERQAGDERFKRQPDAERLVTDIGTAVGRHITTLETHLKLLGGDAGSPVKKAATAVLGTAAGIIDKVRPDTVSTALRDDYTALNLAAISYAMLHTTGLALQNQQTATLAADHLRDLALLIMRINHVIPSVVARELVDEGEHVDTTVGPQAEDNVQRAWRAP